MAWPRGGKDLVVVGGQEYVLPPNEVPSFKSINVQAGGTFIVGTAFFAANPWAIIGCVGDFILEGRLVLRGAPLFESRTYEASAPDGVRLSRSFVQRTGGSGGGAYSTPQQPGGAAGPSQFGNGGGGAAPHGNGFAADLNQGGHGGTTTMKPPPTRWSIGPGGVGGAVATTERGSAGVGQNGGDASGGDGSAGGGGGGGARGLHGGFLYLRVLGHFSAEDGVIDLSGARGGDGGNGGSATNTLLRSHNSGAGGGGGAGGNGGFALIRYGKSLKRGTEQLLGGPPGNGGTPGSANPSKNSHPGAPGQVGEAGSPGEIIFEHAP